MSCLKKSIVFVTIFFLLATIALSIINQCVNPFDPGHALNSKEKWIEIGTNCLAGSMCLSFVPMAFKKKDGTDRAWYDPRRYETTPYKYFFWVLFCIVGWFSWWATHWGNGSPVLQGVLTSLTVLIVVGNGLLGLTNNYSHLVFWGSDSEPSEQPAVDGPAGPLLPAVDGPAEPSLPESHERCAGLKGLSLSHQAFEHWRSDNPDRVERRSFGRRLMNCRPTTDRGSPRADPQQHREGIPSHCQPLPASSAPALPEPRSPWFDEAINPFPDWPEGVQQPSQLIERLCRLETNMS